MKKLSLLLSIVSIITLAGCTTTLTDPSSDIITSTGTQTTVSIDRYSYPEDTLYAYFAQHSTLHSGENIAECYALRENPVDGEDFKRGIYTGKENIDTSERMNYSVSEIHNDHCRGGSGDPLTSPTIGRFLVIGGDVYQSTEHNGSDYILLATGIDNVFRKNQNIYPLDDQHPAEQLVFDYLQKESKLLTGESAQHCFWLSDYEITREEMALEVFNSEEIINNTKPFDAFTAQRAGGKNNCRGNPGPLFENDGGEFTFVVIGDTLYRQLRGDEIDAAGGERWTLIQ